MLRLTIHMFSGLKLDPSMVFDHRLRAGTAQQQPPRGGPQVLQVPAWNRTPPAFACAQHPAMVCAAVRAPCVLLSEPHAQICQIPVHEVLKLNVSIKWRRNARTSTNGCIADQSAVAGITGHVQATKLI